MGEEWAREWGHRCAASHAPEAPAQQYAAIPLKGWGPNTRPKPTVIRGAGPDHPWDAATGEWLLAAPGPQTGWTGDVSSLVRTPVPPRIILHAANVLRATEIRTCGHAAATVRWHPPEGGAAQLAVAHFKAGGPVYDDALHPPTSHTPAGSAGNATRCPPQRRQAPTGARGAPRWPRAPGPNLPQARAGAQRRRPCTRAWRGHTPPHKNARAPRALPFCGSTCTCGTPHLLRTCRTCLRPDRHPPPPFAEPAVPCHADGVMGRDTPGPAAKRRRRPSGAW